MWRRRNANCPGSPWRSRTRWMVSLVADCGLRIGWNRNVDDNLTLEFPISVEHLNATITAVRYVDVVLSIDGHAVRRIELAWLAPWLAPRLEPIAILIDFGNS